MRSINFVWAFIILGIIISIIGIIVGNIGVILVGPMFILFGVMCLFIIRVAVRGERLIHGDDDDAPQTKVDDRKDETVCPYCKQFIGYGDRDFCPHCGKKIDDRLL